VSDDTTELFGSDDPHTPEPSAPGLPADKLREATIDRDGCPYDIETGMELPSETQLYYMEQD
jgi:hypothetical protein